MSDLNAAELTSSLEKITANLNWHIDQEANRRAAERGKVYAKAANERIQDNAVELQRAQDLVGELRAQMALLEQRSRTHIWLENRLRDLARIARERNTGVPHAVLLQAMTDAHAVGCGGLEPEKTAQARQQEPAGG